MQQIPNPTPNTQHSTPFMDVPPTPDTRHPTPYLIGVDTGGTFTDMVIRAPDGSLTVRKQPSTPRDPSQSVLTGIADAKREGLIGEPFRVAHGTTVATNALLERRGAKTALITTQGFRDALEIGRQTRTQLYTFHPTKPLPLLERDLRFELRERLDWQGAVLIPLEESETSALLDELQAQGIESLAVCFLFSYLNPVHERLVERLALERGFDVSLSCDISPEPREYERTSTTVANAFVAPIMSRYLSNLQARLQEAGAGGLRVMQSDGGALSAQEASRRAIATALSGPAGGVVAAARIGVEAGFPDLLTFDMGGTSTDVALIHNGQCPVVTNRALGDIPLRAPMLDIHTVGAGGGSLARIDSAGGLRVGPQSAGADPGPVAYGKGDVLTVTDANVLLGRLPHNLRLGGRLELDGERVQARFTLFAAQLGCAPEEAAMGIVDVANVTMTRALRHVSVERGHDPGGLTLLSFGGAGGLHACALARALGMTRILIPRFPGAFSALGLALAAARRESVYAVPPLRLDPDDLDLAARLLEPIVNSLWDRAQSDMAQEGLAPDEWRGEMLLDMRYVGQSFELRVPLPLSAPNEAENQAENQLESNFLAEALRQAATAFHALHAQRFGHANPEESVEITAARCVASGLETGVTASGVKTGDQAVSGQAASSNDQGANDQAAAALPAASFRASRTQRVYVEQDWRDIPLYWRSELTAGQQFAGPALIVQDDATTYIAPHWETQVDTHENMVLTNKNLT